LNPSLSKRNWALIFGAASLTIDLLPTIHNFRVFSFMGALTTTYTSWYMLSAAIARGKVGFLFPLLKIMQKKIESYYSMLCVHEFVLVLQLF